MDAISRRRGAAAVALLVAALIVFASPQPAHAAPFEPQSPPAPNPDLTPGCGIDIEMILDESGSVSPYADNVRSAFRAFTSAVKNTGSTLAVAEFSDVARLPLAGAANRAYTPVTDATIRDIFEPYIKSGYTPGGTTHWEDAFRVARYFLPRPDPARPHLVVFITDGDPNVVVNYQTTTYKPGSTDPAVNQYELQVPLKSNQITSIDETTAKDRTVPNANAVKQQGSHVLAVAVGAGLNSQDSLNRLIAVSGPDVYTGTGAFPIGTTDVYRVPNFSQLEAALRSAAFALCAPSVTVRKLVDLTPDPGPDDSVPGAGWSMTAVVTPTPVAWVLPKGATGGTASNTTDGNGFTNFQWTTAGAVGSSLSVTEQPPATGPPGLVNDPTKSTCTFRTPDAPNDQNLPVTATPGGFSAAIPDRAIVTCQMVNKATPQPAITLKKFTNGEDADTPPGPFIPLTTNGAPTPIVWSYRVTNPGNVTLSGVGVTDNKGVAVTCPKNTLAPAEAMTCTATGVVADPSTLPGGLYANSGSVTGKDAFGTTVTASDLSHYTPVAPGIQLVKQINGLESRDVPGLSLQVGDPLTFTYTITNTGTSPLDTIVLTDDKLGTITTCLANTLAVGASTTCIGNATALSGFNQNVATVTGRDTQLGATVRDTDVANYFAEAPSVTIVKATNLQDANSPPGPQITVGEPVFWTYTVTNTGNVPLQWQVTDDQGVPVACVRLAFIAPGETVICHAVGTAAVGQYANVGTVTATSPGGKVVTATDASHYFGVQGGIQVTKTTNGQDANDPPGPFVPVGGPVAWTYHVTNTGNTPLTNVTVGDSRGVTITCPPTPTLAVGASIDCTASGSAVEGQYTNAATAQGTTPLGVIVEDTDTSAYFGAQPSISIIKATNGVGAANPPGPFIRVGQPVSWAYLVANTGNSTLSAVTVTDDRGVAVTCPQTSLAPAAEMVCTATGTAAPGQYSNVGSVSAQDPTGATVSDSNPSHYVGAVTEVQVKKLTNGVETPQAPGPSILAGSKLTWTYTVTNTGNVPVKSLVVTDDKGVTPVFVSGDTNANTDVDPGETWTYEATSTAIVGQYTNTATVSGLDALEDPVLATAVAHYVGTGQVGPASTLPAVGSPARRLTLTAVVVVSAGVALILITTRRRTRPGGG